MSTYGEEVWEAPVSYAGERNVGRPPEMGLKIGLELPPHSGQTWGGRVLMHALVGAEAAALGSIMGQAGHGPVAGGETR